MIIPEALPPIMSTDLGSMIPVLLGGAAGATILAKFGGIAPRVPQNCVGLIEWGERAERLKDSLNGEYKAGELYSKEIVRPGTHLVIPYFKSIRLISTQDRFTDLTPVRISDTDSLWQGDIRPILVWNVARERDERENKIEYNEDYARIIFRSLYKVEGGVGGLVDAVKKTASNSFREILPTLGDTSKLKHEDAFWTLFDSCGKTLFESYGVVITGLFIPPAEQTESSFIAESVGKRASQMMTDEQSPVNGAFISLVRRILANLVRMRDMSSDEFDQVDTAA